MARKKQKKKTRVKMTVSNSDMERARWELVNAMRGVAEVYRGKAADMIPVVIQESLTKVFGEEFILL